jgi:NADP-dependent 3-hydroxy acid dehydrogenase YdfG
MDAKSAKIEGRVDDQVVIVITLDFGPRSAKPSSPALISTAVQPLASRPLDPEFEAMASISGRLGLPSGSDPVTLFPALCQKLGTARVGSMGLLSTIVGMIVPGLHSIFAGLNLTLSDYIASPATAAFRTEQSDERFRLVTIEVVGVGYAGDITAFMRLPSIQPPTMEGVAARVSPDRFKDRSALVIGGSRGIGATIAKLLAAGGGNVVLTYFANRAEAVAVESDINTHRKQTVCTVARYDVLTRGDVTSLGDLGRFTHVYYCATSKIGGPAGRVYSERRFIEFCKVYVDGLHALVDALLQIRPANSPLTILYPSSIFVTERPKQMTEYAMAKAAGEILCADLAKAHRNLKMSIPRLPRILTDQTAVVPPVPTADALEVMLPLLLAE